jgi:hypothetical protein
MSKQEIQTLIADLCREMESLWRKKNYVCSRDSAEAIVKTRIQDDAIVLPKSQFPIRGTEGVRVDTNNSHNSTRGLIKSLVIDLLVKEEANEECIEIKVIIKDLEEKLFSKFTTIPNLLERIAESLGYKHYDPDMLAEKIKSKDKNLLHLYEMQLFLSKILANELDAQGFDPRKKSFSQTWDNIARQTTENIYSIAEKIYNIYEVVIFLNAPVIDMDTSVSFFGNASMFSIQYATDELLSKLYNKNRDVRLDGINTAITYKQEINVNATSEHYLNVFVIAAMITDDLVNCLRLVRDEDIGVIALEMFPIDDFTPHIRKTYEQDCQPDLSIFIPKRFYFQNKQTEPLSQEELNVISRLISSYEVHNTKGLDVAIKRLRASYERYFPDDPERLLDIAFAFEAIFLNDGDNKELSYRLALRAARLLGKTLKERHEIFDSVKNLYNFRSKIAHGETLDTMKTKDADKLQQVLTRAPRILKDAIIEMILGNAPRGLQDPKQIGEWWRDLELSMGDIAQVANTEQENEKS